MPTKYDHITVVVIICFGIAIANPLLNTVFDWMNILVNSPWTRAILAIPTGLLLAWLILAIYIGAILTLDRCGLIDLEKMNRNKKRGQNLP